MAAIDACLDLLVPAVKAVPSLPEDKSTHEGYCVDKRRVTAIVGRPPVSRILPSYRTQRGGVGYRNSYPKRTYGIGQAEYDELLAAQGGKCLLCGKQQRYQNLAVDHDHVTGEVRGLLCKRCNEGLGRGKGDIHCKCQDA